MSSPVSALTSTGFEADLVSALPNSPYNYHISSASLLLQDWYIQHRAKRTHATLTKTNGLHPFLPRRSQEIRTTSYRRGDCFTTIQLGDLFERSICLTG